MSPSLRKGRAGSHDRAIANAKKAPAKKTVGLLKCDACRQHRRCRYEMGTSARPSDSSRTNWMSVHSAYNGGRVVGRVQNSSGLGPRGSSLLAENNEGESLRCEGWRHTQGIYWRMQRLTQLELDRLPYQSARSISKICIRRCEPVHIGAARLVPASTGAPQCGREKCVPSFLPSRRLRPSSQLA